MALNLAEALQILEGGDWVDLVVITADVAKGTGGKVLTLPQCRIARGHTASKADKPVSVLPKTERNPNHNANFTRNVELPNKRIISIHPPLITYINSQEVL